MDGLKIIIEVKEERISELEDRAIEITQSGKQKLDPPQKSESEQSCWDPWDYNKSSNICSIKVPEQEKERVQS